MSIIVGIRKEETGEIRETIDLHHDTWEEACFIWTEGNYSCDCNRELFFEEENPNFGLGDTRCSEDRFTLAYVKDSAGEILVDFVGEST